MKYSYCKFQLVMLLGVFFVVVAAGMMMAAAGESTVLLSDRVVVVAADGAYRRRTTSMSEPTPNDVPFYVTVDAHGTTVTLVNDDDDSDSIEVNDRSTNNAPETRTTTSIPCVLSDRTVIDDSVDDTNVTTAWCYCTSASECTFRVPYTMEMDASTGTVVGIIYGTSTATPADDTSLVDDTSSSSRSSGGVVVVTFNLMKDCSGTVIGAVHDDNNEEHDLNNNNNKNSSSPDTTAATTTMNEKVVQTKCTKQVSRFPRRVCIILKALSGLCFLTSLILICFLLHLKSRNNANSVVPTNAVATTPAVVAVSVDVSEKDEKQQQVLLPMMIKAFVVMEEGDKDNCNNHGASPSAYATALVASNDDDERTESGSSVDSLYYDV